MTLLVLGQGVLHAIGATPGLGLSIDNQRPLRATLIVDTNGHCELLSERGQSDSYGQCEGDQVQGKVRGHRLGFSSVEICSRGGDASVHIIVRSEFVMVRGRVHSTPIQRLPYPQRSGKDDPMPKCMLVLSLVLLASCGTPHNSDESHHKTVTPDRAPAVNSTPPTPPLPMGVKIVTVGDMADALGIDGGYIMLASVACWHHMQCRRAANQRTVNHAQCEEGLLLTWCPPGECQGSLGVIDKHNECLNTADSVTCDNIDQVIDCPKLREHKLTLRATDWPQGEMPPDDGDHLYEKLMERATNRRRDPK